MTTRLLAAMLTAVMVMGAVPAAAQTENIADPGMLPSNVFSIFLERSAEAIGTFFTFGNDDKASRYLSLAEERLAEAQSLVLEDKVDKAEAVLDRYQSQLGQAIDWSEGLEGEPAEEISTMVAEATLKHLEVLANVYERLPDAAKSGIERAMQASSAGHEKALQALSAEKRQEIVERARGEIEELSQAGEKGLPVPATVSDTVAPAIPGGTQRQAPRDAPAQNPGGTQRQAPRDAPAQNPGGTQRQGPAQNPSGTQRQGPAGPPDGTRGAPGAAGS